MDYGIDNSREEAYRNLLYDQCEDVVHSLRTTLDDDYPRAHVKTDLSITLEAANCNAQPSNTKCISRDDFEACCLYDIVDDLFDFCWENLG